MRALLATLAFLGAALAGCIDDGQTPGPGTDAPTPGFTVIDPSQNEDGLPPYRAIPQEPTALVEKIIAPAPGGNGVWLWNDRAYQSTGNGEAGVIIFDISDPLAPVELGRVEGQYARDVDVLNYGTRVVIAISGGGPMVFYDVTDPAEPKELARFEIVSHNLAVHRPGHVVYNSRSLGDVPGGVEIYDASDPDDIKLHKAWTFEPNAADGTPVGNPGCHDITVYPDQERAYCAAVTQTLIWDISDPLNPVVLTSIENPAISIHHTAFTISDHEVLVIGDESGGAVLYACGPYQSTPVADVSAPLGAVWFYDLTTPKPALMSYLSSPPAADDAPSTCTAHFGSQVGDASSSTLAYSWYVSGVLLIDASDPMAPRLVDQYDSGGSIWDARFYRGYLFTGDSAGLGILSVE